VNINYTKEAAKTDAKPEDKKEERLPMEDIKKAG